MIRYSCDDFRRALLSTFPELAARISDDESMGVYRNCTLLAQFVNDALKTRDSENIASAMKLAVEYYSSADASLASGFQCDFFEVLELRSRAGRTLFESLSPQFQEAYVYAQNYIGTPYDRDVKY